MGSARNRWCALADRVTYGVYWRLINAYETSSRGEDKTAVYRLLKSV